MTEQQARDALSRARTIVNRCGEAIYNALIGPDKRETAESAAFVKARQMTNDILDRFVVGVLNEHRHEIQREVTAREDMADFPVGTIARDTIGRVFIRTDILKYPWRTIWGGGGFDLSDDQATTYTPVRILWMPDSEGEQR